MCPVRPPSVRRRWWRTIGEKVEGSTPLFAFKVRHRAGMTIAHQIAHFSSPFYGVDPSTVIPAGRPSSRQEAASGKAVDHKWPSG